MALRGSTWVVVAALGSAACGGVSNSEKVRANPDGGSLSTGGQSNGGSVSAGGLPTTFGDAGRTSGGMGNSGGANGSGGASGSSGGAAGGADSGGAASVRDAQAECSVPCAPGALCQFTVTATTVTANGTFAPHNVGAIWIEDDTGAFVKTLTVWGLIMLSRATGWMSVSDGNNVDAVTGATRPAHGPVEGSWNCTDVNHSPVPSGSYRVCLTFAEDNTSLPIDPSPAPPIEYCVPFGETGAPLTLSAPDAPNFQNVKITLTY